MSFVASTALADGECNSDALLGCVEAIDRQRNRCSSEIGLAFAFLPLKTTTQIQEAQQKKCLILRTRESTTEKKAAKKKPGWLNIGATCTFLHRPRTYNTQLLSQVVHLDLEQPVPSRGPQTWSPHESLKANSSQNRKCGFGENKSE